MHWVGSQASWGFIAKGAICHDSPKDLPYANSTGFTQGDIISVKVDFTRGTIGFAKNGQYLGDAFHNLRPGQIVYPAVSMTGRGSMFKLVRFQSQDCSFSDNSKHWGARTPGMSVSGESLSCTSTSGKWEMCRTLTTWNRRSGFDLSFRVVKNPATKNRWKIIFGAAPGDLSVPSQSPAWLNVPSWGFVSGTGDVYYGDPKSCSSYLSSWNEGLVQVQCLDDRLRFGFEGVWGRWLDVSSLSEEMCICVCLTGQGATLEFV
jgi:hypothetical protein